MKKFWIIVLLSAFFISCGSSDVGVDKVGIESSTEASKGNVVKARVARVKDGDTLVANSSEGEKITCRLYGVDAPETAKRKKLGQPYGKEAFQELKSLVLDQDVNITVVNTDRYGRSICQIEKENLNVNLEMVKRGLAWAYVEYLKRPHASIYLEAEKEAREKKLGLWKDVNPTPPWEFRKLQKKKK